MEHFILYSDANTDTPVASFFHAGGWFFGERVPILCGNYNLAMRLSTYRRALLIKEYLFKRYGMTFNIYRHDGEMKPGRYTPFYQHPAFRNVSLN